MFHLFDGSCIDGDGGLFIDLVVFFVVRHLSMDKKLCHTQMEIASDPKGNCAIPKWKLCQTQMEIVPDPNGNCARPKWKLCHTQMEIVPDPNENCAIP